MEVKRKTALTLVMILLTAVAPMIGAALDRIWTRQYDGNQFTYTWQAPPMFAGFVCNEYYGYAAQSESVALEGGSTWITVVEETYTEQGQTLLMDFTFDTTAEGARLVIEGQYLFIQFIANNPQITENGAPFDIPADGSFTPNLADMNWAHPNGATGKALQLTFSIDSSGCFEPEGIPSGEISHSYNIIVGIGTEILD